VNRGRPSWPSHRSPDFPFFAPGAPRPLSTVPSFERRYAGLDGDSSLSENFTSARIARVRWSAPVFSHTRPDFIPFCLVAVNNCCGEFFSFPALGYFEYLLALPGRPVFCSPPFQYKLTFPLCFFLCLRVRFCRFPFFAGRDVWSMHALGDVDGFRFCELAFTFRAPEITFFWTQRSDPWCLASFFCFSMYFSQNVGRVSSVSQVFTLRERVPCTFFDPVAPRFYDSFFRHLIEALLRLPVPGF